MLRPSGRQAHRDAESGWTLLWADAQACGVGAVQQWQQQQQQECGQDLVSYTKNERGLRLVGTGG